MLASPEPCSAPIQFFFGFSPIQTSVYFLPKIYSLVSKIPNSFNKTVHCPTDLKVPVSSPGTPQSVLTGSSFHTPDGPGSTCSFVPLGLCARQRLPLLTASHPSVLRLVPRGALPSMPELSHIRLFFPLMALSTLNALSSLNCSFGHFSF